MPITELDNQLYHALLTKVPRTIDSEVEYNDLLSVAERLHTIKNLSPRERALYRLILWLTEKYESEKYPTKIKPCAMLRRLMVLNDITNAELAGIIGSDNASANKIAKGDSTISEVEAELLGYWFDVFPEVFLE